MADIVKQEAPLRWRALEQGAEVGHIEGEQDGPVVALVHTEVAPEHNGKGIAGDLVRAALDDIRAAGQRVRPVCPYVGAWLKRHPEYADLVAPDPA